MNKVKLRGIYVLYRLMHAHEERLPRKCIRNHRGRSVSHLGRRGRNMNLCKTYFLNVNRPPFRLPGTEKVRQPN